MSATKFSREYAKNFHNRQSSAKEDK